MKRDLIINGKNIRLPIFLPDATYGVVRSLSSDDLKIIDVRALMMNTFHLMQKPGSSIVQALGGLHTMSAWDRPIFTDSGGFQVYSLIKQNPKYGSLIDKGIVFHPENAKRRILLTPEKVIQLQFSFNSDVMFCLDECTHVEASYEQQKEAVDRTIAWAIRGKDEFNKQLEQRKIPDEKRPLLFAIIQGGGYKHLRKKCAEELISIGFDGFGFGGWPLDSQLNLITDILGFTRAIVPEKYIIHALGIGSPRYLLESYRLGYDIFDCTLPTRDARHGRLYQVKSFNNLQPEVDWFQQLYINDKKHIRKNIPISDLCDCPCCKNYSVAYLQHLFKIKDTLYFRLATLHNLRIMSLLTDNIHHAD